MSDTKRAKAIVYAEDELGVHEVFKEVVEELNALEVTLQELDKAQALRRELDEKYADREVELVHEMRGIHPSMTDTRFKSEWRGWERSDVKLRDIRIELMKVKGDISTLEVKVEVSRSIIKAGCARMEQLGGYLNYLAAVKNRAEHSEKLTKRDEE